MNADHILHYDPTLEYDERLDDLLWTCLPELFKMRSFNETLLHQRTMYAVNLLRSHALGVPLGIALGHKVTDHRARNSFADLGKKWRYFNVVRGKYVPFTGKGTVAELSPTPALAHVFDDILSVVSPTDGSSQPLWRPIINDRNILQLRGAKKVEFPSDADDERKSLRIYNELVDCTEILYAPKDRPHRLLECRVVRIFNRDWEHGGRLARSEAMILKGRRYARSFIKIGGADVAELDYSGMHLRMLYHLIGRDMKSDPYVLFPKQSADMRKIAKKVNLVCINALDKSKALYAIKKELEKKGLRLPRGLTISDVMQRFMEVHAPIQEYFFSGVGLLLMCHESHIARSIMDYFSKRGIPCLPIHDSFVVPAEYEDELHMMMIKAYKWEMGKFNPVIH